MNDRGGEVNAEEAAGPGGSGPAGARRRFLTAGAAAAAAAVAGVMATERPASAANGDNLEIGQTNTGTSTSTLNGSQLSVNDGNQGRSIAALHGGVDANALFAGTYGSNGTAILAHAYDGTAVMAANNGDGRVTGRFESYGSNAISLAAVDFGASGGTAIYAASQGTAIECASDVGAALRLKPGPAMPPATGVWEEGALVVNQGLWFCTKGGTGAASKWVKLSSPFVPLDLPKRIYDSRPGLDPAGVTKGKIGNGQERVIDAKLGGAVPPGASAVQVNLTVTETNDAGYLSLFRNGSSWPGTSSINWAQPGTTVANGTTVAVDGAAKFKVRCAGETHVVIDVLGYYL